MEIDGLTGSYTATEKEEPSGGIPGFPYEAIILGVMAGTIARVTIVFNKLANNIIF